MTQVPSSVTSGMQKMSLSSSLGATLFESTNEPFKRYGESGSSDELDQAIRYAQQAVDSTPSNDPKRTKYLADLRTGYYARFVTYRKEPSDAESAISTLDQSVKLTPADDPEHAHRLVQLGNALLLRFNDKSLDTNPTTSSVRSSSMNRPSRQRRQTINPTQLLWSHSGIP